MKLKKFVRVTLMLLVLACLAVLSEQPVSPPPVAIASISSQAVPNNTSWGNATSLSGLNSAIITGTQSTSIIQTISNFNESRWYVIPAVPGSRVTITLSGGANFTDPLPINLDLALYSDLDTLYNQLTQLSSVNLPQLTNLAANVSPANSYAATYFPATYFPATYFPATYFPATYFPATYFGNAPENPVLETKNVAQTFQPARLPSLYFPPDIVNPPPPAYPVAEVYSGVVSRGLLRASIAEGTAPEALFYTPQISGNLYIRVRGRDGANSTTPFTLSVTIENSFCQELGSLPTSSNFVAPPAQRDIYQTLILTRFDRLEGTSLEQRELKTKLDIFKARSEVLGKVIDFSDTTTYKRVAEAYELANSPAGLKCPYTANLLATEIKKVVEAYNGIKYIIILGSDNVIPFFRYPDRAGVANEYEYIPPALPDKPGRSNLLNGLILSQDEYGVTGNLDLAEYNYPLPEHPVGRLVGDAWDIAGMLQAYLDIEGKVKPQNSLVTGYDFSTDTAQQVKNELSSVTTTQSFINSDWTSDTLKANFVDQRYDLAFISGHASAGTLVAPDYSPLRASLLDGSAVDHSNSIYFGLGCHSLYNIGPGDSITGASANPDWATAFARQRITAIGGTTFQYGGPAGIDSGASIDYGELLYLELVKQLKVKTPVLDAPVALGDALVNAKRRYLASRTPLEGIHEKTALVATLYGLPMLKVDLTRTLATSPAPSVVTSITPVTSAPGLPLRLNTAVISATTPITQGSKSFGQNAYDYFIGKDGATSSAFEPILAQQLINVSYGGKVLRGVGFLGGDFTTGPSSNKGPLTKSPATEFEPLKTNFNTLGFYPTQPWEVNYFDALSGGAGVTRLALFPVQYRSNQSVAGVPASNGVFRQFSNMQFRLYYSDYASQPGDTTATALVGPPHIEKVSSTFISGTKWKISVTLSSPPTAGVQDVWVTLSTEGSGSALDTKWSSSLVVLTPNTSNLWEGFLDLATLVTGVTLSASEVRFMVQAVNGLGMTTLDTNNGAYYQLQSPSSSTMLNTTLTLQLPPGGPIRFLDSPVLTATISPVITQGTGIVQFQIGQLRARAVLDGSGNAVININSISPDLKLTLPAGVYNVTASFNGFDNFQPSSATISMTIEPLPTQLQLINDPVPTDTSRLKADFKATTALAIFLSNRPIFFVGTSLTSGQQFGAIALTNNQGEAYLSLPRWPAGNYTVCAYSGGIGSSTIPVFGDYFDFYYSAAKGCSPSVPAVTVDLTVTSPTDDGNRDTPGTLSYALARTGLGLPFDLVKFLLPVTNTVTITGRLPTVPAGVRLNPGTCSPANRVNLIGDIPYPNALDGTRYQRLDGLLLHGNNLLQNLRVTGFPGRLVRINGIGNHFECTRLIR